MENNYRSRFTSACFAILLALGLPLRSLAERADFSGNWILKGVTSLSGVNYINGVPGAMIVTQTADNITIERINVDGEVKTPAAIEMLSFTGAPSEETVSEDMMRSATVRWSNDLQRLDERIHYNMTKGGQEKRARTESWTLSDSGQLLTVIRTETGANTDPSDGKLNWSMKGTYQKQVGSRPETSEEVHFEQGLSWQQIQNKAKSEYKYIFVDCYATWCGPCKEMDRFIYPNPIVAAFLNERFISVRVQMDKTNKDNDTVKSWYRQADEFSTKYNTTVYPTYLFFGPDGRIVHRGMGYMTPANFITVARDASDPGNQVYGILARYRQGDWPYYSRLPAVINAAKVVGEPEIVKSVTRAYVDRYLNGLDEAQLLNRELIRLNGPVMRSTDKLFDLCYHQADKVDKIVGHVGYAQASVENIIEREEIDSKLFSGSDEDMETIVNDRDWDNISGVKAIVDDPEWDKIGSVIAAKYNSSYSERAILNAKIKWYGLKKDFAERARYSLDKLDRNGLGTFKDIVTGIDVKGYFENDTLWQIFEHVTDKAILDRAVYWGKTMAEANPDDTATMDTYANLLYKDGRGKEAIKWEERAAEIAEASAEKDNKKKPDPIYQNTIDKMEKGLPTWGTS